MYSSSKLAGKSSFYIVLTILLAILVSFLTIAVPFSQSRAFGATPDWSLVSTLGGKINSISCPSTSTCYAIGQSQGSQVPTIFKTQDFGSTWTTQPVPSAVTELDSITCPSLNHCVAVGTGYYYFTGVAIYTTDGGNSWSVGNAPQSDALNAISCPNDNFCMAVGGSSPPHASIESSNDGGANWTQDTFPTPQVYENLFSVACTSSNQCLVGGFYFYPNNSGAMNPLIGLSTNGGATFSTSTIPQGLADITSIQCPTQTTCYAIGITATSSPAFMTSVDGGATWSANLLPNLLTSALTLFCPAISLCVASGGISSDQGAIEFTTNGGSSWNEVSLPLSNAADADSLGCTYSSSTQAMSCMASGANQVNSLTYVATSSLPISNPIVTSSPQALPSVPTPPTYLPYIPITGDSNAYSLGVGLLADESQNGVSIALHQIIGCGIVANGPYLYHGQVSQPLAACPGWQASYASYAVTGSPHAALLFIGRWDSVDRMINGVYEHLGEPAYDNLFLANLRQAIDDLSSGGEPVALITSPYFSSGTDSNGSPWPEDNPARVQELNKLEQIAALESHGVAAVIDLGSHISPNNSYARVVNGVPIRSNDGVHFTIPGAIYTANWLLPRIALIALHYPINHNAFVLPYGQTFSNPELNSSIQTNLNLNKPQVSNGQNYPGVTTPNHTNNSSFPKTNNISEVSTPPLAKISTKATKAPVLLTHSSTMHAYKSQNSFDYAELFLTFVIAILAITTWQIKSTRRRATLKNHQF
ncbi:MAG: hypothetical protein HKL80_00235 [Acidimicrobiales bacterium]|nr:hypothetical protein [Acidimicrobiales bacterium]